MPFESLNKQQNNMPKEMGNNNIPSSQFNATNRTEYETQRNKCF